MGLFNKSKETKRTDSEQDKTNAETKNLQLYQTQSCPYCMKVRIAMKELNVNIELRDINLNQDWEKELISHGGKRQVPCLKITDPGGIVEWLYESGDIIEYLKKRFG